MKSLSDTSIRRLAQVVEDEAPPYSGSRDALLENTILRLIDVVGIEPYPDEVQEWLDVLNTSRGDKGERSVLRSLKYRWDISDPDEREKALDVLAWSAHEMLDYDFEDKREYE